MLFGNPFHHFLVDVGLDQAPQRLPKPIGLRMSAELRGTSWLCRLRREAERAFISTISWTCRFESCPSH
jgi:hypothetical protein